MTEIPPRVAEALRRAQESGFDISSEVTVGQLLATLAAAVPQGGRILELGTGEGVGLAWLVTGVGERSDVEIVTVEYEAKRFDRLQSVDWPEHVIFVNGDGAEQVERHGQFDLIFADAPGGKIENLSGTIAALRPYGILMVDDMDLSHCDDAKLRGKLADVRRAIMKDPRLVAVELKCSSGVILATRR